MTENAYHFIGIGGIGMSGLARILLSRGVKVSGSDVAKTSTIEKLIEEGATIYRGQSAEHIKKGQIVVYSTDIKTENPEYQAARVLECPLWHRSDLLNHLIQGYKSLAVTGTHGKTTTSSLLAAVLLEAETDASFALGGILANIGTNARGGKGELFAFEADESDGSFLRYHPFGAIVTNIDNDHLGYYKGSTQYLIRAFKTCMDQVQSKEHLFWCGDDPFLSQLNYGGYSYGFAAKCDWRAANFRQKGFSFLFDIHHREHVYQNIEVALIAEHNALNALAVFALCKGLGITEEVIRAAFRSFKGALRRCEKKGEHKGILFIDDYGHHPTEIHLTLKAICKAVPDQRVLAVFQPHRYSRTKDCLGQYASIFDCASQVMITDVYAAGEKPIEGVSSHTILDELQAHGYSSHRYVPRDQLVKTLADEVQPGDVVVTFGAGDITHVGNETLTFLKEHEQVCVEDTCASHQASFSTLV